MEDIEKIVHDLHSFKLKKKFQNALQMCCVI